MHVYLDSRQLFDFSFKFNSIAVGRTKVEQVYLLTLCHVIALDEFDN